MLFCPFLWWRKCGNWLYCFARINVVVAIFFPRFTIFLIHVEHWTLLQDRSNSSAFATEFLQSCAKLPICCPAFGGAYENNFLVVSWKRVHVRCVTLRLVAVVWKRMVRLSNNIAAPSHHLGPIILLRYGAVARLLANGSAAFVESCAVIGWKDYDSVRSLQ